jgi:MarR family transcriptional regulator, organic hydroperoxide resistance regulator
MSTIRNGSVPTDAADPVLDFMRLMWSVDHELQRVSKRMLTRIGLTAPQRLAVRVIGQYPGLTLGALAQLLHLHPGTVTGIVRRLERNKLVIRTRNESDTRRVHLTLTAAGQRINRRRKGTVEAAVRRGLDTASQRERASASRVLLLLAKELAAE